MKYLKSHFFNITENLLFKLGSSILFLFVIFIIVNNLPTQASSGINKQLNYQGKLNSSSGTAVSDGNYNLKFVIYDASSGGTCLWTAVGACDTADYGAVTVATINGIFSVALGASGQNSIATSSINFNADSLYLGVTVGSDTEMTPRKRITSSAYAFNADQIDGIHATSTAAVANYLVSLDSNKTLNLYDGGVSTTRATTSWTYFVPQASVPDSEEGKVYYNAGTNTLYIHNGVAWQDLLGAGAESDPVFGAWETNFYATTTWAGGNNNLVVTGNATTTGNLNISGYASTTNLVLADGASNLGTYYDLYINSGNLFFDGTQLTGSGGLGIKDWQFAWDGTIKPTSTVGIYVAASSTIAANFRIDGNATTTGSQYIGSQLNVATTSPWSGYELAVAGDQVLTGNFYGLGNATTTGSYYIGDDLQVAGTATIATTTFFTDNSLTLTQDNLGRGPFNLFSSAGSIAVKENLFLISYDDTLPGLVMLDSGAGNTYYNNFGTSTPDIAFYVMNGENLLTSTTIFNFYGRVDVKDDLSVTNTSTLNYINLGADFMPTSNLSSWLGASDKSFAGIYTNNIYSSGTALFNNANIYNNLTVNSVASNLTPSTNLTYSLGTSDKKWLNSYINNIYASGTSMFNYVNILQNVTTTEMTTEGDFSVLTDDLNLPQRIRNLYIADNYAYLALYGTSSWDSFRIVDISNPQMPRVVGGQNITNLPLYDAKRVFANGNYAYILYNTSASGDTFRIIDIADKSNPHVISGQTLTFNDWSASAGQPFYVSGNYAYVMSSQNLYIVDISNPYNPKIIGQENNVSDTAWDIKVVGDYAYVCHREKVGLDVTPLSIVDVKDKTNPILLSDFTINDIEFGCWSIDVNGPYAYLGLGDIAANSTNRDELFRIVDISDPANPTLASGSEVGLNNNANLQLADPYGGFNYIKILGERAYVTTWQSDLLVIDIASSTNPKIIRKNDISSATYYGLNNSPLTFDFKGNNLVVGYAPISGSYVTSTDYLRIFKMPGIDVWGGHSDAFSIGTLQVTNNSIFNQRVSIWDSLEVGAGGISTQGTLSIMTTSSPNYIGGYLGIGTTTAAYKLVINSSSTSENLLQVSTTTNQSIFQIKSDGIARFGYDLIAQGYSTTTGGLFTQGSGHFGGNLTIDGSATSSNSLYVGSQLNVATTSPWAGYELAISGDQVLSGNFYSLGNATTSGTITGLLETGGATANVTYADIGGLSLLQRTSSMRKYKTDINYSGVSPDLIYDLKPVSYTFIGTGVNYYGFIAEDVASVDPRFGTWQNGEVVNVEWNGIISALTAAVKDQKTDINEIKNQIALLQQGSSLMEFAVENNSEANNENLTVTQTETFYGTLYVQGVAGFMHKVVFEEDIEIKGKIYASADQAGTATILANATSTEIIFNEEYEVVPKIVANLVNDDEKTFVNWKISKKTASGFTIILQNQIDKDITFDWIALAVMGEELKGEAPIIENVLISKTEAVAKDIVELWTIASDSDTNSAALNYSWSASPSIGSFTAKGSYLTNWSIDEINESTDVIFTITVSDGQNSTSEQKTIRLVINEAESNNQPLVISGCTDLTALNYNFEANQDDGSCSYLPEEEIPKVVLGCIDSTALNYNSNATKEDGTCEYEAPIVYGCTDATALNYDLSATQDSGGCEYKN